MISTGIAIFCACFVISGWGIPVYCPRLLMDRTFLTKRDVVFAAISLLAWQAALAYAVYYIFTS